MDVPAGHAEVRLDVGRRQRERVGDQVGSTGRELVADRRAASRRIPHARRPNSNRRFRTAPTRRTTPTSDGRRRLASSDRPSCGCTTRSSASRRACPPSPRRTTVAATRAHRLAAANESWRRAGRAARASSVNAGRSVRARFTFIVVPYCFQLSSLSLSAAGKVRRADQLAQPKRIGRADHDLGVDRAVTFEDDAPHRAVRYLDAGDGAASDDRGARIVARARPSVDVTVPIPPRTTIQVPSEPGSRHMLCTRKLWPDPGVSQVASRPDSPSVTAYIALTKSLVKPNRSRYSPTLPRHRSTNTERSSGRM